MSGFMGVVAIGLATPRLSDRSVNAGAVSPSPATAEIEFVTSGTLNTVLDTGSGGVVTSRLPEWHGRNYAMVGAGSNYEIRCTVQSGSSPSGGSDSIDTWLALTAERSWILFRNSLGLSSGIWLIEIRGTSGATLASATYTMTASVSSP